MKKLILAIFLLVCTLSNAQNLRSSTDITDDISIQTEINKDNNEVKITFTGPVGRYYAIGLDAALMSDNPYTFMTQDNEIQERTLGNRSAGTLLTSSTTLISDEVVDGKRVIKFSRPLTGPTAEYFDFSTISDGTELNFIWAVGNSFELMYHGDDSKGGDSQIKFTEDTTLSIDDITTRSDASYVVLSPVPVRDMLNVTEINKIDSIEIYNVHYQKVKTFSKAALSESIDVSDLAPSTYFVKVVGNDGFQTTATVVKE